MAKQTKVRKTRILKEKDIPIDIDDPNEYDLEKEFEIFDQEYNNEYDQEDES